MKFGQLIEYNVRYTFLQKSGRKWGWETSSRPLVFFKKKLVALDFHIKCKNKLYENVNCWPRDMLNFDFLATFSAWFLKKYIAHALLY